MKTAVVFLAVIACALAYGGGLKRVPNGVAAPYKNADRQVAVNKAAEAVGAGTGTARYYGVPGAKYGYYGYPAFGYYGYPGYAYGYGYYGYPYGAYYPGY